MLKRLVHTVEYNRDVAKQLESHLLCFAYLELKRETKS